MHVSTLLTAGLAVALAAGPAATNSSAAAAAAPAGFAHAQEPSPDRRVEEVRFASGDIELAGRLWLPDGPGPHPAMVFLPGSGQSIRNVDLDPDPIPYRFLDVGVAYLAWDKRGVRDSGGEFVPLPDRDAAAQEERLRLLASDAVAAMRYLATRDDIAPDRIGAWAFSQGGWVAPLLEQVGGDPAFIIVVGGPAVTIGEENRFSEIADAAREASRAGDGPISIAELDRRLEEARGTGADFGGFDPYPHWERTAAPTLFLLGAWDLSVPTSASVRRLERLGATFPWIDHRVFPRASHGVAVRDAAGQMYFAPEFFETQYDFLYNLGIVRPARLHFEIATEREP